MTLQELYAVAYAPVQKTSLDAQNYDDIDLYSLIDELNFLKKFANSGFGSFVSSICNIMERCEEAEVAVSANHSNTSPTPNVVGNNVSGESNTQTKPGSTNVVTEKKSGEKKLVSIKSAIMTLNSKIATPLNKEYSGTLTENVYQTQEMNIALHCLVQYLGRVEKFCGVLHELLDIFIGENFTEPCDGLKELTTVANEVGFNLENKDMEEILNAEAQAEWLVPKLYNSKKPVSGSTGGNKVGFENSVSVYTGGIDNKDQYSARLNNKSDYQRSKVRKATGYSKFNFRDNACDIDDSMDTVSTDMNSSTRSGGSNNGKNVPVLFSENSDSQKTRKIKNNEIENVNSHQYDSDSNTETFPLYKQSRRNENYDSAAKFIFSCCYTNTSDDINSEEYPILRKESSVALGTVEEIEDDIADTNWHDTARHKDRYTRIRKRVPTGHPNIMKVSSEEMIQKV